MKNKINKPVEELLEDIQMADFKKYETVMQLRGLVFSINPQIEERVMYGGVMFSLKNDWGGVFVRKNHISFEFAFGVHLNDPDGLLEGTGEFRRHLKLRGSVDIENKKVAFFIKQALEEK